MIKDSCLHLIIKCVVCSVKLLLLTYYIFFFSLGQIVFPGTENCMKHSKDLLSERNKEQSYMSVGFSLRKKAPKCFENHQQTNCHKAAAALETVATKFGNIAELTNQNIVDYRRKERKHLIDVIRCLRFLARQGTAIQGNPGDKNFTQLLKLLRTKILQFIQRWKKQD